MWIHKPNLLRAAMGSSPSLTPANFGAQSLFNNSSGTHLLRVWFLSELNDDAVILYTTKTRLATQNNGVITSVVTDEVLPPGQLDQQDLGALHAPNYSVASPVSGGPAFGLDIPIVVLKPGWSLVMQTTTAAVKIQACFWWDYIYPEELIVHSSVDPVYDK